jgi:5S rRNA maturation endonuclease (ribonuclease M5)
MVDVQDVLGRLRIDVTKETERGVRLWAKCPSGTHEDANPSWSIMASGARRGAHYCASCHYGGHLVDLVMTVRDVGYHVAREWLAEVEAGYGARAPALAARVDVRPVGARPFRVPLEVVFEPLSAWPTPMRRYAEARGIDAWQVERWRVGYAVDGRLAGRIVLVTRDAAGTPAGYAARTISRDPAVKRYLAPRGEERPDFGVMFGEERWPSRAQRDLVVVLEGALNALAVERALVAHGGVASLATLSGSRAPAIVFAKLATFSRVVSLTDSDRAGDLVDEELKMGLGRHVDYRRVRLRPKTDPDSISPEELWERLCLDVARQTNITSTS